MILLVDFDKETLVHLESLLKNRFPDEQVAFFTQPLLAVKFAFQNRIDVLFSRISMKPINGFEIKNLVCKFNGKIPVYFMENDDKFRELSDAEGTAGFFTVDKIDDVFENLSIHRNNDRI